MKEVHILYSDLDGNEHGCFSKMEMAIDKAKVMIEKQESSLTLEPSHLYIITHQVDSKQTIGEMTYMENVL